MNMPMNETANDQEQMGGRYQDLDTPLENLEDFYEQHAHLEVGFRGFFAKYLGHDRIVPFVLLIFGVLCSEVVALEDRLVGFVAMGVLFLAWLVFTGLTRK